MRLGNHAELLMLRDDFEKLPFCVRPDRRDVPARALAGEHVETIITAS